MDPYLPPETVASERVQRRSLWTVSLALFLAAFGYVAPFCLNALANVQRLGPMPFSDAFYGFKGWHWPPTVTAYLLLVPNVFAMIVLGTTTLRWHSLSVNMKRILIATECLSLLLVYVYWIGFCFGYPTQPSPSQAVNNALYAVFTVGLPCTIIVAAILLLPVDSDEQTHALEPAAGSVSNGESSSPAQ